MEVVDDGIGIDPANLSKIFNAFEQGEDSVTKAFGGLGLGLAISRSIAEGHGGTLTAASEGRGLGTSLRLELPSEIPSPRIEEPSSPEVEDQARRVEHRVLLVEDDIMTSRVMAKLLRQNGYVVTTANSVADALQVPFTDYNLLVSDIGLPDGSGLDLMRAIGSRHEVVGIALTGFGMEDDILKSREAGFVAHLTKPLDFAKLDAMIRRATALDGLSSSH